ncbi:MAG: phage terminase large subunit family protein, partial [Desulfarculaceae bacterium]|nr:phage terminase large subunit family protein [Desulfarculaceae bacterium]
MITATVHDPQLSLMPEVELYPAEVEVFRKREKLSPSQWSEKYRVVTDGPWKGPWRNENTPYLVEPMDTWAQRGVREVVVVAITQSGKTQLIYNCWGYGVDQRQATSLVTMADKETAHNVSRDRFQPIIEDSPRLSRLKTGRAEDMGLERLRLLGSLTYLAWASSAARLQTMPIEHCYGDEVALYKSWSGKGVTDPVSMLRGRITTFRHTGKLLLVSSVYQDSDPHWKAFLACQEKRAFALRCPQCGQFQLPGRAGLHWDESISDPDRLQSESLAWYECEHCGAPWSDAELRRATL